MLLTPAGVITAVMLVTTFGHGWDTDVKLENTSETGSEKLFVQTAKDNTLSSIENGTATFYQFYRRDYI